MPPMEEIKTVNRIEKTKEFLLQQFQTYGAEEVVWRYRYEHTLRVAAIGKTIAVQEGFDRESVELSCLLHDIGYIRCKTQEDFEHHGKLSAEIAAQFLPTLDLDKATIDSICYALLVHSEEESEHPRPCTAQEATVTDADNIDRFDALRMADTLTYYDFMKKRPSEIIEICNSQIERFQSFLDLPFATKTATALWRDRLGFQLEYFRRLKTQMDCLCGDGF